MDGSEEKKGVPVESHPFISVEGYNSIKDSALHLGINVQLWQRLTDFTEKYMGGRPGFEHHTWTVVDWGNKLSEDVQKESVNVNPKVVISSCFLHDIGYALKAEGTKDPTKVQSSKDEHIVLGLQLARPFVQEMQSQGLYTQEEADEILRIVEIHDDFEEMAKTEQNSNARILFAADTLGAIDKKYGEFTFRGDKLKNWIRGIKTKGGLSEQEGRWQKIGKRRWNLLPDFAKTYYLSLFKSLIKHAEEDGRG